MNVIKFPRRHQQMAALTQKTTQTESQSIRDFALNIATQLRNDDELNSRAPFLVDKVIMLLINESRDLD